MKLLKGKKLLVVSSDGSDMTFVNAAKALGVYVICCDRYSDWDISPAKAAADEAWDMDYSDTEAVVARCRENHIDGVIAGYSEERVTAACRISNVLGTPFYATEDQIEITRNKKNFKSLCQKFGIVVPIEYCQKAAVDESVINRIAYPVIVKPSDNGGRKGISVCRNKEELESAMQFAVEQSKNKEIVVEQYLTGIELCAVYTIANGEISLSCLNDKYVSKEGEGASCLCDFVITPSKYYTSYLHEVDAKIKELLKSIGARNGVANFQFIVNEDGFHAFEMGFRVNGNDDYKVIRRYNDIDFSKMLISFSLTGDMGDDLSKDNPLFPEYSATLCLYLKEGTIGKVDYGSLDGVAGIHDISIRSRIGKQIIANGTTGQKAGMIKFSAKNLTEIAALTKQIKESVRILDMNGNDMILSMFDENRLFDGMIDGEGNGENLRCNSIL